MGLVPIRSLSFISIGKVVSTYFSIALTLSAVSDKSSYKSNSSFKLASISGISVLESSPASKAR